MVPLRLTLKNFMCYRDDVPTLDLEGIHVACLCGDNGHGKTALLDAMTWALWGKARAGTQEELIHQGRLDMYVELDFLSRGQRYRVTRRYSRSGRTRQGHPLLELQVVTEDGATPLTEGVSRETQARITDLIHMDYETFTNTAFLKQGDADRFTTSTPSKRKETLAEVLDLSYYAKLEERAKERSREAQMEAAKIDSEVEWRRREIARRPQDEENLAGVVTALERIEREVAAQREVVDRLRSSVQLHRERRNELADIHSGLSVKRNDIKLLETQVGDLGSRVGAYESAVAREQDTRQGFNELQGLRTEQALLDRALGRKTELDAERFRLDREIAVQHERLSGKAAYLRAAIDRDRPRAESLGEIESRIAGLVQEEADVERNREGLERQRTELQRTADRMRDLEVEKTRMLSEMEDTRKKFDMLERGDSLCPLCNQTLGPGGKEHLRREYEGLGRESRRLYDANSNEMESRAREHKELGSLVSSGEAEVVEAARQIDRSRASLESERDAAEKARAEVDRSLGELERLERTVAEGDFTHEERKLLEALDADLSDLEYDRERHRWVRERTTTLAPYDELHRKLLEAVEKLGPERESLSSVREVLHRRKQEVVEAEERGATLQIELAALESDEYRLATAEALAAQLDAQRTRALGDRAVLEQQIRRAVELEQELEVYEGERRRLADEKAIYDELATAFGKNGVQALIIETAIPQLEIDSNEVLMRLTENRMNLKLQLQKGRRDRRGQPSEELDIRIADEVGTRSYETFSGGEAFRINFALRIALSRLLARRAGAPLPTLLVDEGFGSQDSAGQERLIEAIRSIQDDFEKIIVITHIEQIKEAFPVRIEVTKTEMGSTFAVV